MNKKKNFARLGMFGVVALIGVSSLLMKDQFAQSKKELMTLQLSYGDQSIQVFEREGSISSQDMVAQVVASVTGGETEVVVVPEGERVAVDIRGATLKEAVLVDYDVLIDGQALVAEHIAGSKEVTIEKEKSKQIGRASWRERVDGLV